MVLVCIFQTNRRFSKLESKNQKLTDNYHGMFLVWEVDG